MKILFAGGGSGGPISPLLAVAEALKIHDPESAFLLVGTKNGPEKLMAAKAGMSFLHIPAGKLRRYFSFRNFFSPFLILAAFFKSFFILLKFRPDCIFAAGSFVQVPVIWAGWFLKIPSVIHQQDYLPSMANSLCQIPAKKITVTFNDSLKDFSTSYGFFYKKQGQKIYFTGNPFRKEFENHNKEEALNFFHLHNDLPVLLVLGGGTGSEFLNKLIGDSLPFLQKTVQIIHSSGKSKFFAQNSFNYKQFEFISDMGKAYAAADLVLCRAGLSTITELSNLGKISIIVPMPNSHQEVNAYYVLRHNAGMVIPQGRLTPERLVLSTKQIFYNYELQETYKKNIATLMPKDSAEKIAKIILETAK